MPLNETAPPGKRLIPAEASEVATTRVNETLSYLNGDSLVWDKVEYKRA